MTDETVIEISKEFDIVTCRKAAREKAVELGFGISNQTRIVTAISELTRNVFKYAGEGKMTITEVSDRSTKGIKIVFTDNGPGLDTEKAIVSGYSTQKGSGMGLPGAQKLMDEFELQSEKGKGTTVTVIKWL